MARTRWAADQVKQTASRRTGQATVMQRTRRKPQRTPSSSFLNEGFAAGLEMFWKSRQEIRWERARRVQFPG